MEERSTTWQKDNLVVGVLSSLIMFKKTYIQAKKVATQLSFYDLKNCLEVECLI